MTKNALIFSVVVFLSFFLNIFTNTCFAAEQHQTAKPDTIKRSITKPPITEPYHHYYHHDEDSDGGKSMAFLRLGRSVDDDAEESDEIVRKEIETALKSAVSNMKHNIAKRSNEPEDLDDGLIDEVPTMSDGENNGELEQSYGPREIENEEELQEKEAELANIEGEENGDDILDLKTLHPYSSFTEFLNKRNSFSLRPMKRNNFSFRPMKRNNFEFRPMKKSNFAFLPMKRTNFEFRPMKRSNFAFRPMKRNGDSFTFRPFKKSGSNFKLRPMRRARQFTKDSFLRYGKRDSFALRPMKRSGTFEWSPMKRPEGSFVLRPMKKNSFSLRPMKKDTTGFQLRPMKRSNDNYDLLGTSWSYGAPVNPTQRFEEYDGIDRLALIR